MRLCFARRGLAALLSTFVAVALAASTSACRSADEEGAAASEDELRQIIPGVDTDEMLVENVPASPGAPAALANVRSWEMRFVELRDPTNASRPDPADPFTGFFLIAKDEAGKPIFFNAMSFTDEGIAHFFFSLETDAEGNYLELPLLAGKDDAAAAARVKATTDWLANEKKHVAAVIRSARPQPAPGSIQPLGYREWRDRIKCAADLAVFGLTFSNPIGFFLAQAAVEGVTAIADGVAGENPTEPAASAALNAGIAATAKGAGKVVTRYVSKENIARAKGAGGKLVVAGLVGAIGYQTFKGERGVGGAVADVAKLIIPQSCQDAYAEFTKVD